MSVVVHLYDTCVLHSFFLLFHPLASDGPASPCTHPSGNWAPAPQSRRPLPGALVENIATPCSCSAPQGTPRQPRRERLLVILHERCGLTPAHIRHNVPNESQHLLCQSSPHHRRIGFIATGALDGGKSPPRALYSLVLAPDDTVPPYKFTTCWYNAVTGNCNVSIPLLSPNPSASS